MPLTPAQKATLKTHIAANVNTIPAGQPWSGVYVGQAISALPNQSDAHAAIAGWYNLLGPANTNTVWKTNVPITKVGDAFVGTELAGLTALNNDRLRTLAVYSEAGINPSLTNRRQFFDDIFSGAGGVNTRAALLILWKRLCTNAEKIFATGTGSDANPATMVFEGQVTSGEVEEARNLP